MTFHLRAAAAIAGILWAVIPAAAQQPPQKPSPQRPPVIINDPSLYRAPPPPHERNYVGPQPSLSAPMDRLQQPSPLAPPPIR